MSRSNISPCPLLKCFQMPSEQPENRGNIQFRDSWGNLGTAETGMCGDRGEKERGLE